MTLATARNLTLCASKIVGHPRQDAHFRGVFQKNCRKNLLIVTAMSFDTPFVLKHNAPGWVGFAFNQAKFLATGLDDGQIGGREQRADAGSARVDLT